jgi:hypothetical protein
MFSFQVARVWAVVSRGLGSESGGLFVWGWQREDWMAPENIIPVMFSRAEAADRRVESDHLLSHGVAGSVGVEAAVDGTGLRQKSGKPAGIGPCAGCGYAARRRMQEKTTYGVDGRFAEHDHCWI